MNKRAVALFSGGLDSQLAVRMVQEQGIEVIGVYFAPLFYLPPERQVKGNTVQKAASNLNIELLTFPKDVEFFEMIHHPKHGYGSAINPCLDCTGHHSYHFPD